MATTASTGAAQTALMILPAPLLRADQVIQ
jgi:hypothetical protein